MEHRCEKINKNLLDKLINFYFFKLIEKFAEKQNLQFIL